jgi:hypothetical protein
MASYLTTAGSEYMLSCLFGRSKQPWSAYYFALLRSMPDPGSDGANIDEPVTSVGYQRARLANDSANFTPSGYYESYNAVEIVWPTVPAETDWGKLIAFGMLDVADPGKGVLIMYGTLTPAQQPAPLSKVRVRVGQLAITVASMSPSFQPT